MFRSTINISKQCDVIFNDEIHEQFIESLLPSKIESQTVLRGTERQKGYVVEIFLEKNEWEEEIPYKIRLQLVDKVEGFTREYKLIEFFDKPRKKIEKHFRIDYTPLRDSTQVTIVFLTNSLTIDKTGKKKASKKIMKREAKNLSKEFLMFFYYADIEDTNDELVVEDHHLVDTHLEHMSFDASSRFFNPFENLEVDEDDSSYTSVLDNNEFDDVLENFGSFEIEDDGDYEIDEYDDSGLFDISSPFDDIEFM